MPKPTEKKEIQIKTNKQTNKQQAIQTTSIRRKKNKQTNKKQINKQTLLVHYKTMCRTHDTEQSVDD